MKLSIPRGIVYHKVVDDLYALISSLYEKLDQSSIVEQWEDEFAKYIGKNHSLAFPYARTAIYYALKSQNFPEGSEIIMPPITIKGILDVVLELKLKPVFVDISLSNLCFDEVELNKAITSKTKAILITYLFGIVPDLDNIIKICKNNNLFSIEDFSQCLNGIYKNKKVGSFGDVGVCSTSSIKTLDTYGGGLLVCDDKQLFERLKDMQATLAMPSRLNLVKKIIIDLIRNIATTRVVFHFFVLPILKLISILRPGSVIKHTGGREQKMILELPKNWFEKYTSFQAQIGLKYLNEVESMDSARILNVEYIKSKLNLLSFPEERPNAKNVYWQLVFFFNNPKTFQKSMQNKKVDTASTSLELISELSHYPFQADTPNANYLCKHGMFIPCYPGLSKHDLKHISNVVNLTLNEVT
jgi:perosamine synthetase